MSISLEERIVKLEKLLGGKVSTEFDGSTSKNSKIKPLATIYVCRIPRGLEKEKYLITTEYHDRSKWAKIPSPYPVIAEYFGEQEGFSDVMKIIVHDWPLNSAHIYSPDLEELVYSDNIVEDYFGKHLLLKRVLNLSKAYQEFTNIGVKVDTNGDDIAKKTLKA